MNKRKQLNEEKIKQYENKTQFIDQNIQQYINSFPLDLKEKEDNFLCQIENYSNLKYQMMKYSYTNSYVEINNLKKNGISVDIRDFFDNK